MIDQNRLNIRIDTNVFQSFQRAEILPNCRAVFGFAFINVQFYIDLLAGNIRFPPIQLDRRAVTDQLSNIIVTNCPEIVQQSLQLKKLKGGEKTGSFVIYPKIWTTDG